MKVFDPKTMHAICRAFYHKSRGRFVPLTGSELDAKAGVSRADRALAAASGLVSTDQGPSKIVIYEVTHFGRQFIKEYEHETSVL